MPKLSKNDAGWLLPAVLGLVLLIFAKPLTSAIEIIIGVGLILAGATGLLGWWQNRQTDRTDSLVMLVLSLLGIALGIWIVTHVSTFNAIIKYLMGGLLIVSGLQWFFFNRHTLGLNTVTVLAGLCVVLGIIVIAAGGLSLAIRIVGLGLIVNAVCGAMGLKNLS